MLDPVIAADGFSIFTFISYCQRLFYERKNIMRWLEKHDTSPATGLPLVSKAVIGCSSMRNTIQQWAQTNSYLS